MKSADQISLAIALVVFATVVSIGGLFYPDTIAGAVARFVFSLN